MQRIARLVAIVAAALALTAGLLVGSTTAQAASVLPEPGHYLGHDHHARVITFSFSGNQMMHFRVNHHLIGGAHVSHGMWHETCHGGYCTKGMWTSDTHVSGAWRHGGGTWVHFTANWLS